jgi:hypothetical protein
MFDLGKFIENANKGIPVDVNGFRDYVSAFENVIIWGAGNLGKAVGKSLLSKGIRVTCYWDIQAEHMGKINGFDVNLPFSSDIDKDKTLVVFCIGNVLTRSKVISRLHENQFKNIMDGVTIREALYCPMSIRTNFDGSICSNDEVCAACGCNRLDNLVKHKFINSEDSKSSIYFSSMHFLVNTLCNLSCKYCYQYMGSYPHSKRGNISSERLCRDIDTVLDAVDAVGTVFIVGGETFLHPHISVIVRKILEKKNLGLVVIPTNGMIKIKEEQLDGLQDKRIRVAFSNYIGSLSAAQEETLLDNLQFAKTKGVNATLQNSLPSWNVPGTFERKTYTADEVTNIRKNCAYICNWTYSGKIFLCSFAISMYNLIEEYSGDFVDIDKCASRDELRDKIRKLMNSPYIPSCMYCDNHIPNLTDRAGEQGFDKRYEIKQ